MKYTLKMSLMLMNLHSYEAKFIQELLRKGEKKLAQSFIFTFRDIE